MDRLFTKDELLDIGYRIKDLCYKKGMDVADLADYIGASRSAVYKWTQGISSPKLKDASRIAKIFKVSIDYIVTGSEYKDDYTDDEKEIIKEMRRHINPEGITRAMLNHIRYINKVNSMK